MKQNEIRDSQVRLLGTYNYENLFNVYQDEEGRYFYNLLQNISFPTSLDRTIYSTVRANPGELLPQLSFRVYNVVNLWWLIAGVNDIYNPLEPLDPDVRLKIIDASYIESILNTIKGA